ncbi:hypothetical protein NP233_g10055 [Leucocoprinus birnbaumii]|uniref:WD40 repeat-like protein n=1 Tax=Leucocoprinus birnbaumii TaxID=56174 RepID=A0AAD5VJ94_9AGAR|nr:hypothetical protein NP233_g10055 [Leucocoprinus birnbaumii]
MPEDLPGFYWDPQRNRYFPIAHSALQHQSVPQPTPPPNYPLSNAQAGASDASNKRRRRRSIWRLTDLGKSDPAVINRRSDLFGLHVAKTWCVREERVPIIGEIKHFIVCFPIQFVPSEEFAEMLDSLPYSATSFGPTSKLRVQKLDDPNLGLVITPKNTYDIRCSSYSYDPNEVVVGARQHAVHLTDIFNQPKTRILKTHSDVFSIVRDRNLIYAGTRNGSIHRFDLRVPSTAKSTTLFDTVNNAATRYSRPSSTVLHMQLIDDLLMYDVRYTQHSTPILQFKGHVNSNSSNLGIVTDPTSSFLFAAGQDNRIRAWSLRTAEPLPLPLPLLNQQQANNKFGGKKNPFLAEFDKPVETLQITDYRGNGDKRDDGDGDDEVGEVGEVGAGMCLWAGCGKKLYRFDLGSAWDT